MLYYKEGKNIMSNESFKSKQKISRFIRWAVLLAILIFMFFFGIMHQLGKPFTPVGVDSLCPFGGIETLYALIVSGELVKRIAVSSVILLIAVLATAIFFRRTFCGNICPLGTVQEIFSRAGEKVFKKKRLEVPYIIDKPARYLKYIVLIVIVLLTAITGELIIREYDPWVAFQHLTSNELFLEFTIGFIILVVSVVLSFFYNRFFCKYLCPMGAVLGIVSKIGIFRVSRDSQTCISCGKCAKVCPVNIPVDTLNEVTLAECISCNECVNNCPVPETLSQKGLKGKVKVSSLQFWTFTMVIYAGLILLTTLTGTFEWKQKTLSETISASGEFDPEGIKGRMSIHEIHEVSGIPENAFIEEFGYKRSELKTPIKDLNEKYEMETEDVREFVTKYLKEAVGHTH